MKYFGITLSADLKWNDHIGVIAPRLSSVCYLISRLQYLVSKEVLVKIYYWCFHSVLSYGVMFWGAATDAERISILQKRAIRLISKDERLAHCRPLFKELQILTLSSQLILECSIQVKKHQALFITNGQVHKYGTRKANDLRVMQVITSLGQSSPEARCIKIYNHLPSEIKIIQDRQV